MDIGIKRRLNRILPYKGTVILPLDGAFIDGPIGSLHCINSLLESKLVEQVEAVIGYIGLLKRLPLSAIDIPFIVNMSGSTQLQNPTQKVLLSDVELAVRYGADAVCFQLHLTDKHEQLMLQDIGKVITIASQYGMPVLITVYPRKESNGLIENYEHIRKMDPNKYSKLIAHCVRVAVELGADIVKTAYPGSLKSMAEIVEASMGVPIVIAGGDPVETSLAIDTARDVVRAGGWGVAYGRQIYMAEDPVAVAMAVRLGMTRK